VIPVYDDWEVLGLVVPRLGDALAAAGLCAHLVVVDDGSRTAGSCDLPAAGLTGGTIVRLRRNLGHQRAIAVGLAWVHAHLPHATTVVMDSDGEDNPADVPRLIAAFDNAGGASAVFAARQRRSESFGFQLGYHAYKVLHRVLVGLPVRIGNFSVLPWAGLRRLMVAPELWNHYAAAVVRGRLARLEVPTTRAKRLAGHSTMRFVPLVLHGLSAIAVFADLVAVRVLVGAAVAMGLVAAAFGSSFFVPVQGVLTEALTEALPDLGRTLFQAASVAALAAFAVLASRQTSGFLPERDALVFVDRTEVLEP
jgi:hypothetical protein